MKETFESVVIALILAFLFRAYVVEAFVIPTGSMAPTLLGRHADVTCHQCGYRFNVNWPGKSAEKLGEPRTMVCPMCHYRNQLSSETRSHAGDRILVQKYLYSLPGGGPKRWDVVVFKSPTEPQVNYIKRLVGLPEEELQIIEGNIYVRSTRSDASQADREWHIARKTDRPRAQRAVWQPVTNSRYAPLEQLPEGPERIYESNHPWRDPWLVDSDATWAVDHHRSYQFKGGQTGVLAMDMSRALAGLGSPPSLYPYNQYDGPAPYRPIEDVRLSMTVQPQGDGLSMELGTTARVSADQPDRACAVQACLGRDGEVVIRSEDADGQWLTAATGRFSPFKAGQTRDVEFWFVDQEASIWIDGDCAAKWPIDLPIEAVRARAPLSEHPRLSVTVHGAAVTLHGLAVDRDLDYQETPRGEFGPALGGFVKPDPYGSNQPAVIRKDRFFCLGDNSPWSRDSRLWGTADPWIERRLFDDGESSDGMVPRELMMGRAFFVYFPALRSTRADTFPSIPNFGDIRFIH